MGAITEAVVRRGREIYQRDLRARLEAEHHGRFAAIDPDTGDFQVADDELSAVRLLRARIGPVQPYVVRIGARAAYRMGARFRTESPS